MAISKFSVQISTKSNVPGSEGPQGGRNLQNSIIPIKIVDGFMVLNFCTSSDDALYLYQVS